MRFWVRGAVLWLTFFASHESNFKVLFNCYSMVAHRVLGLTVERASDIRKYRRCNAALSEFRGY
jgi:hypothetical protein